MLGRLCACGSDKAHRTARDECQLSTHDVLRADQSENVLEEFGTSVDLEVLSKRRGHGNFSLTMTNTRRAWVVQT